MASDHILHNSSLEGKTWCSLNWNNLIYSFNQYFLSAYYIPDPVLGIMQHMVNKIDFGFRPKGRKKWKSQRGWKAGECGIMKTQRGGSFSKEPKDHSTATEKERQEFPGGLAVEDPALSLLWLGSPQGQGFNPWLGNFCMPRAQPKKKKKKKR